VRIGFLGAGLIATYHAASLRASGEPVTWATVHDPDRARAEVFAASTGARACASEEEALDGCDAVYVCTWTSEHPRLVVEACRRRLAVFCEKPLARTFTEAKSMAEAVAAAGVANQVGLVLRSSPALVAARRLLDDPAVGSVMGVVLRDDQYLPVQGMYQSTWRADAAKAGSGVLLEHSIHDLDLFEWMAGPVEAVSAQTAAFHGIPGIEDAASVQARLGSGGLATLVTVWHDVLSRPSMRLLEVHCERAVVAVEHDWWGPVRVAKADGTSATYEGQELLMLAGSPDGIHGAPGNPDAAFVRAVREGRPATPDFAVALRAHALVDAAYRSAACGSAVQVPLAP
jgi:predicted dehydrogenase